jgi:uncharacterized protein (DUF2147 family)
MGDIIRYPQGWRTSLKCSIAALVIFVATAGAALANPDGIWRVEDGSGNVRIAGCGKAYCGFADNRAPVFLQMRPSGPNAWSGVIRDIRDNSEYDGTITLLDRSTLRVHGCLSGTGMCGDQTWTRIR